MSGVEIRTVAEDEADMRLDRWFRSHFPGLAHGRLEKLLRTGQVRLDGKRVKANARLEPGQSVRVPPLGAPGSDRTVSGPKRKAVKSLPTEEVAWLRDAVLYRDDEVLAIDKPAGLAVQGGSGQSRHLDAMLDALRFEAEDAPRLVHRLDKDTSGVLVLARTRRAARALTEGFRDGRVEKSYWAAVLGVPRKAVGLIDLPLAKTVDGDEDAAEGERVTPASETGQSALSLYALADHAGERAAWLLLRPLTGRTHQLRVHCAALGHAILGDGKYGGRAVFPKGLARLKRVQLHAREIALPHPSDGTTIRIQAPLPADMAETWKALGFDIDAGDARSEDALSRYLDSLPNTRLAV